MRTYKRVESHEIILRAGLRETHNIYGRVLPFLYDTRSVFIQSMTRRRAVRVVKIFFSLFFPEKCNRKNSPENGV